MKPETTEPSATHPEDSIMGATSAEFLNRRSKALRKPPATLYGAIDIGTNSVHLVLVEISPEGDFRVIGSDKEMVRLGRGGFSKNELTDEAMDAGIAALRRFVRMARLKRVTKLKAVATSAVREARNGGDFVARAKDELDLLVNVISMEEEGRLIYRGVANAVDLGTHNNLIVDIGGGSVELIVGTAREAKCICSVKLGGLRLAELFLHSDPHSPSEYKALRQHVRHGLADALATMQGHPVTRCIGTSGTIRSLAMLCAHRRGDYSDDPNAIGRITVADLRALRDQLRFSTRAERLRIPGMDARRVDGCLPAAIVLLEVMRGMNVAGLEHCASALREGVIVDYIGTHRRKLLARATWPDPRMRSVIQLAERCDFARNHSEHVAGLAVQLFDGLQPVLRLPEIYRELLRYAGLLHDIGYLIGHPAHHKHAYYLISNGKLRGFDAQEIQVIANIARYHRKDRPRKSHYSFQQLKNDHRQPVRRLSVLLRLADALDRTHYQIVDAVGCEISPDRVDLRVHTAHDAELELWTVRRIAPLFEKEFDLALGVRLAGASDVELSDDRTD
jgi:exopolyphosphatase/guanosine-5'-triphosphate,3'-diphosphate pyrophosphatase